MTLRFKALLAQRAPAEGYPPLLHQTSILSTVASITVLDTNDSSAAAASIDSLPAVRVRVPRADGGHGVINRLRRRFSSPREYVRALRSQLATGPDVCIAFDAGAVAAMLTAPPGHELRVAHLHEHPTPSDSPLLSANRAATRKTLAVLRTANLVTVPDQYRAELLVTEARLTRKPSVVMNCPMTLTSVPTSKLIPWLAERGAAGRGIVHYHGGVGQDHCLEKIIESMPLWTSQPVFVIVGRGHPPYIERLKQLAASVGVPDRLFFVGPVTYKDVFQFAAGATVGVSILDPTRPNWRYSAGASNKRFEYVSLGIPQVTNEGPGITDLFERTGVGITARFDSAESIGATVNLYLDNEQLRRKTSETARALHLSEYNYEKQFAPVLATIETALARRETGRHP